MAGQGSSGQVKIVTKIYDSFNEFVLYNHFFLPQLGSIWDSLQSWKSGKFQLARWSLKGVIQFGPSIHPPTASVGNPSWILIKVENSPPHWQSMCSVPTPTKYVRCPHPPSIWFSQNTIVTLSKKYVNTLALSWILSKIVNLASSSLQDEAKLECGTPSWACILIDLI